MPNLRTKTWTTTTPAYVEDAQFWEDHLISDAVAAKAASSVQTVNSTAPDANGNVDVVALPAGGTVGQVLTKKSSTDGDADWENPASSGHTIKDEDGVSMTQQPTLQFLNADVTNDLVNSATVVDCKGAKGDAATISVGTTTTLVAGSDATVTNSGTSSAAVFNFGIPKGADGADGADGSDGADGVSVTGVTLYSTSGRVKTYRMTFSDGTHFDYEVTDGENGSGAGDMLQSDYDPNQTVYNAGGIVDYVAGQAYTLPTASTSTLGGVKVGTNLSIADGVLSAIDTKALSSMTDVAISSATGGQVLTYDSTASKWKNASIPSEAIDDLSDVTISSASDGQALLYNSTSGKWENGNVASGSGGSIITVTTSASSLYGQTVTLTDGVSTMTKTLSNTGVAVFEGVTMTGTLTVSTTSATPVTLSVPYYGNYSVVLSVFSATVTITYPSSLGATCTLSDGVTTLSGTGSPMAFSVPNTGTWTATCSLDGASKTQSFTITTDGQTESYTFEYGTINLTYSNEFQGVSLTCTDGVTTITKTAPISGNTMAFYPPNTGTWTISGVYSGVTYSSGSITVSSLSTAVSATIQTLASITVTIYGAKQDTITFTDAAGVAHTVTFAAGATSKSETLKVNPTGTTSITFTSSVAKNPSNLSQNFSKTVSLTTSSTTVEVYPVSMSKVFYWYGFYNESILNDVSDANGWTTTGVQFIAPTRNTHNLTMAQTPSGAHVSGVASKNTISGTLKTIARATSGSGGEYGARSAKTVASPNPSASLNNASDTLVTVNITSAYGIIWSFTTNANIMSALWYE